MEQIFHKYLKIKILGDEDNEDIFSDPEDDIVIEEKIDGANFRFMIKDCRIIFGSHNQSIGDSTREIGGNWKRCVEHVKEKLKDVDLTKINGFIFYGECCVKHSMEYDWTAIPPYLGFDIYSFSLEEYVPYTVKKELFEKLGLEMVPLIKTCKAKDMVAIDEKMVPKSAYSHSQAEGVVMKNYSKQLMAKFVTDKFKEVNREAFGGGKKFAQNDDERLVATYCTNARIDKCIFKLLDEGNKLEMKLMEKLGKMVLNDIYEEHSKEICWSSWSVNFKKVRTKIGRRCVAILKQVMVNNSLNK